MFVLLPKGCVPRGQIKSVQLHVLPTEICDNNPENNSTIAIQQQVLETVVGKLPPFKA